MSDVTFAEGVSLSKAAAPSLIQSFVIEDLYGYRTIGLESEYAATILIAKNGSGKTTLLAALDAFLRCQFLRLKDLEFGTIRCKLRGIDDLLVLNRTDLLLLFDIPEGGELSKTARRVEIDPVSLFNFLEIEFSENTADYDDFSESPAFMALLRTVRYNRKEAIDLCNRIRQSYYETHPAINSLRERISAHTRDIDIVYLPTFRRIELPLQEAKERRPTGSKRLPFKFPNSTLFTGDIQFGLADISERLETLNRHLLYDSNISYRKISASIINELLDGHYDVLSEVQPNIPDREELTVFLSRLEQGRRTRVGPFLDVPVPNIDRIYSGEIEHGETNKFLTYFLNKLNSAIQATRDIEVMVEAFIFVCNKYLSLSDVSTAPPGQTVAKLTDPDGKKLQLDRRSLQVHVESIAMGRRIPLNALSSGEKQMISLFAKLFLYEKEKIILVDEPELSLSIEWQRQLLEDFLAAPNCRQVVAITHSPFVFDNSLEPFARSMRSRVDPTNLPRADAEEDIDVQ